MGEDADGGAAGRLPRVGERVSILMPQLAFPFLRRTARGSHGAWQRFERGEIALFAFYDAFGRDLSDTAANNPAYASYCARRRIGKPQSSTLKNSWSPSPFWLFCGLERHLLAAVAAVAPSHLASWPLITGHERR